MFKCVRYVVIMWFTSHGPYIIRRDSYWHRSVRTKYREATKNIIYNHFDGAKDYLFEAKKKSETVSANRKIKRREKLAEKNTVMLSEVKIKKNCTSGW